MTDEEMFLIGDMFTMREAKEIERIYMSRKLARVREHERDIDGFFAKYGTPNAIPCRFGADDTFYRDYGRRYSDSGKRMTLRRAIAFAFVGAVLINAVLYVVTR